MKQSDQVKAKTISEDLIAPCGMNCRLCWGYIRDKNRCPGCLGNESEGGQKSKHRTTCRIKNCAQIVSGKAKYCSESCHGFPCARLRQLDKRYRTKYVMSMIGNLKMISKVGLKGFVRKEAMKWTCPKCGCIICVHRPTCLACGYSWHEEITGL